MTASEPAARTVEATINYVAQGSFINRRFVAPGVEHNTGRYEAHRVTMRDGRPLHSLFTLDIQGFVLAERPSAGTDFFDRDQVERLYPYEVVDIVRSLTGATRVATLGWMLRTSGDVARHQRASRRGSAGAELRPPTGAYTHRGGVQPPAGEAHVDFMPTRAESLARTIYERSFPDGKGFNRFIASSLWRAFSPPPQDCPLALCDARSVRPEEGIPNTMFVVDRLPDEPTMLAEMPNEATAPAAAIFHYNPAHRWWYFSNMTRDEVLMFKFHDSDRTKALRTPHTAFQDPSFADARPRESIEVRSIAYFE
jgi:hypothetical protein